MNLSLEQREELLAAYALDALESDERTTVEAELAADPSYRRQLAEYEDVLAGIATFAPTVAEPVGHRARMMQKLTAQPVATTQMAAVQEATPMRAPVARPQPRRQIVSPPQLPLRQRIGTLFFVPARLNFATTAISLVLVFGLIFWNLGLQGEVAQYRNQAATATAELNRVNKDMADLRQQVNTLNAQLTSTNNQNVDLQGKLTDAQTQLAQLQSAAELLGLPTTAVMPLPGNNNQAFSRLIANPAQQAAILLAYNLTPNPKDKTYEFWFVDKKGNQLPAGTFSVNESGKGILKVEIPQGVPMSEFTVAGVTMEPAGGMPKPTGAMIIVGNL